MYVEITKYLRRNYFFFFIRRSTSVEGQYWRRPSLITRALRAVLEIGNSSIFGQFRAVFTDFCSKVLGSNFVKLLEIARKLLEKKSLLEISRIIICKNSLNSYTKKLYFFEYILVNWIRYFKNTLVWYLIITSKILCVIIFL